MDLDDSPAIPVDAADDKRRVRSSNAAALSLTPTPNPSPQGGGESGNADAKSPSPLWGGVRGGGIGQGGSIEGEDIEQTSPTSEPLPSSSVTIVVCSSCRDESGSDAHPRAGHLLGLAVNDAAKDTAIVVRQVECLGNCKRRLSAALLRDGCWSYVFGDLTLDNGPDLVAGAQLFAVSDDGLIPWRGRPDCLKRGLVARVPPLAQLKDIA